MTHVLFTVPSFMNGGLPASGVVTKDVILTGTDDVTVTIKSNTNTFYTDTTRVFDTISSNDTVLYQFIFPLDTQVSPDTTTYTTPKKSVYVFSDGTTLTKMGNKFTKNVTKGDISIRPPVVFDSSLPDSSLGTITLSDIANDSPFHSALLLIYKLFMDMIPIFIFWALFVSISCWVKIKSVYLYPCDVTEYPFVFYGPNIIAYHPFKSDGNDVCYKIPENNMKNNIENQNRFFDTLKNLPEELKKILDAIYPDMQKMSPESLHPLSQFMLNSCKKKDKCNWDYVVYFLLTIAFQNYIYCNTVLSFIHTTAYYTYEKIISKISSPFSILLFTVVLYLLFMSVGSMNEIVMQMFQIHLEKETSIDIIILNQFYKLLITILSCLLSLILPLCGILVTTTLLTTLYTLASTLLGPFNAPLFIMALFTLAFTMTSYALIFTRLGSGMNPLEMIDGLFSKEFGVNTFFIFFGLMIPIFMGIGYAFYMGMMLFITFFQFFNLKEVVEDLKSSTASIVLLALILLVINVKEMLGDSYTMMTFMIIIGVGYYVNSKLNEKEIKKTS